MKTDTIFEKVSFEQFKKDYFTCLPNSNMSPEEIKELYDNIKLPCRATQGSAGYDFYSPVYVTLVKNTQYLEQTIPTGIRVKLPSDCCLLLVPRSGLGFKNGMHLANTIGVIDSDYYFSNNEGHIMAKLVCGFDDCMLKPGERFMQGIIINYGITCNDETNTTRNGGFGSTGC